MAGPLSLKIELPKIPDIELVAVEGLERLARSMGITDEKIGEARIILTEAVINAFEHGGNANPRVDVEFTVSKKELVIFVRDYGKGFEPSAVVDPHIRDKIHSKHKRGWGLKLLKAMSDDLRIESGKEGTKITMKKFLH